jgi:hypothetical protein
MSPQTYLVKVEPVSPGTKGSPGNPGLSIGNGQYVTQPVSERTIAVAMTDAQLTGLQGYLICIKAGLDTSSIETAVTAVGPT